MICLLVMTDGRRDCLSRAITSLQESVDTRLITSKFMHDDSGDKDQRQWLRLTFPEFQQIGNGQRKGFGRAVRFAREVVRNRSWEPYCAAVEDDFIYNRPVPLDAMAGVLASRRALAQLVLRRQPVNDDERRAGGVVEMWPKLYQDCGTGSGEHWLEHRLFWSTNPSLFRRELLEVDWPGDQPRSEALFTARLLAEGFDAVEPADVRFGFWGRRTDPPWITHIGDQRAGTGY